MSAAPPMARPASRALALPNLLTYARCAAVPVVAGLMAASEGGWVRWLALAVFIAAGVTDYLDGHLARLWGQQSALGRMLDPIADKLLVAATLFMLAAEGTLHGPSLAAAIVILCREVLVSGLREFLAELKVSLPVSRLAKYKTTLQLVAIGFLIAAPVGDAVIPGTAGIGLGLLWSAAILTLYTGLDYFAAGLRHVVEEEG